MIAPQPSTNFSAGWVQRLTLAFTVMQSGASRIVQDIDFVYGCIETTKGYVQHLELEVTLIVSALTPPPKTEF